jgi:hypothetical protein
MKQDHKNNFLYSRNHYHGKIKPENIVFNANLQEFAQRISYIVNLETGGKLPTEEAYNQIQELWEQLQRSKDGLRIGIDNN